MDTSDQIIHPAEGPIDNDHVGDQLPVILLQDGVGADGINETCNSWYTVDELQVKGSSPSIVLVLSVDVLLLFTEHEPVEAGDNEVADDSQGVEEVMAGLHSYSGVRSLQGIHSKVGGVVCSRDGAHE